MEWAGVLLLPDHFKTAKKQVKLRLSFEGDKACADNDGKPSCNSIFIEGNKFYEVRDDGALHATSTLKQ